jgi:hypothetical protein
MTQGFEYMSYNDADRIAILENKAAELERRLLAATPPGGTPGLGNVAAADSGYAADPGYAAPSYPATSFHDLGTAGHLDQAGEPYQEQEPPLPGGSAPGGREPAGAGAGARFAPGGTGGPPPDGRTEALINHGRQRARRGRWRRLRAHWRLLAVAAAALLAGAVTGLIALGGGSASWPASVTTVKAQIKQACQNADVAAEPSGLNFACDPASQQVLWVFSLLTSGDNPGFVDQATGRRGLEPIQPSQGGDIAWSLNLHHPYNPVSPVDSLAVAARAINNIISGATLTSTSGTAQVEPGLESKAANCQRYTGSARLVTRQGYPARCAAAVTAGAGEAALVSDVFQQWMGGTPSTLASEAGVLFGNAGNPGDSRVQAILNSLPASGG